MCAGSPLGDRSGQWSQRKFLRARETSWASVTSLQPITQEALEQAREQLILRRETHLDQLVDKLQAFLQRIVNGGGRIEREYGLGNMRTDLLVRWPYPGGIQTVVLELKVLHKSLEQTVAAGLEQTWAYMDRCNASEGHLVVFDRTPDKPWEEKLFQRQETHRGRPITIWGM